KVEKNNVYHALKNTTTGSAFFHSFTPTCIINSNIPNGMALATGNQTQARKSPAASTEPFQSLDSVYDHSERKYFASTAV
uniref:hypothetical protein n=1 Tax=Gimesia sp. TaxID=2024833 RepID=UPI003A8DE267